MTNLTKQFIGVLQQGLDAAKLITEADKKALAYAELAKSIAMTGLVTGDENVVIEESKTTTTKTSTKTNTKKKSGSSNKGKDSLKPEASKGNKVEEKTTEEVAMPEVEDTTAVETVEHPGVDTTQVEPVVETQEAEVTEEAPAPTQEAELEDEWTDAMCELLAEELNRYNEYVAAWGEDYVNNDCVSAFFEGACTGAENIRPTNIRGFVSYLDLIASSVE